MGRRGPRPTPSAVQKRRGTYRPERRRGEPTPEVGVPDAPDWLGPEASEHWSEIAELLDAMGVLALVDQIALGLLCDSLAEYVQAKDIVEQAARAGEVKFLSTTDKGNVIQHPAVGVKNKAWERTLKMLREFGMTPSARAALKVGNGQETGDPLTDLLGRIATSRN